MSMVSPSDKHYRSTTTQRHIRALAILLAQFALLLATGAAAETSLWKISKGANNVYLGGTVHVLRQSDYPLPTQFESAYRQTEQLVLELDLGKLDPLAFQQQLLQKTRYPAGRSLADHLSPEALAALKEFCAQHKLPVEVLMPFKPAFTMLTLMGLELAQLGITSDGVDSYFAQKAGEADKPVLGLETAAEQLDFLAVMGEGQESEFILHTLQDLGALDNLLETMVSDWRSGNTAAMDDLFVAPMAAQYPAMYQSLLVDRNQAWLPRIEALLQHGDSALVLVGVAHLIGKDGLLQALEKRGYQIEQY